MLIPMIEDWDGTGPGSYYDELGGAYYFADDKERFEARTPGGGGCGCLALLMIFVPALLFMFC